MKSVITIKAFSDNFIYLYRYEQNKVIAIDTGDSEPVLRELEKKNLSLTAILVTHHHNDHTGGASELKMKTGCRIIGGDGKRINDIDGIVEDKQILTFGNIRIEVIATPGHTTTSVCYYIPKNEEQESRSTQTSVSSVEPRLSTGFETSSIVHLPSSILAGRTPDEGRGKKDERTTGGILFTGDTLFIGGCGRLFECNAQTMWNSLQKLAALPDDTKVYPGHDYALENNKFALQEEPNNPLILKRIAEIKQGKPSIPSTIALEKETNIFLKAKSPEIFAELRRRKDNF